MICLEFTSYQSRPARKPETTHSFTKSSTFRINKMANPQIFPTCLHTRPEFGGTAVVSALLAYPQGVQTHTCPSCNQLIPYLELLQRAQHPTVHASHGPTRAPIATPEQNQGQPQIMLPGINVNDRTLSPTSGLLFPATQLPTTPLDEGFQFTRAESEHLPLAPPPSYVQASRDPRGIQLILSVSCCNVPVLTYIVSTTVHRRAQSIADYSKHSAIFNVPSTG